MSIYFLNELPLHSFSFSIPHLLPCKLYDYEGWCHITSSSRFLLALVANQSVLVALDKGGICHCEILGLYAYTEIESK